MSIVEKAAERLRRELGTGSAQRPTAPAYEPTPHDEARPAPQAPEDSAHDPAGDRIALDRQQLNRQGLFPPEAMAPHIAREYQRIKRPLLAMLDSDGEPSRFANRFMITSANPGDGKSFTAFNLALSLAGELDRSVVLVDGDVAKPGISRGLGLHNHRGLMELLVDQQSDPNDYLVATDEPRLSVLPAGARGRNAVERLSSRRMNEVTSQLADEPGRIVLFDSAPLLAAAESQALATHVGHVLMIVRAGSTEKRAVDAAVSLLEPSGADISLILNQNRMGSGDDYAGYYGFYPNEPERSS